MRRNVEPTCVGCPQSALSCIGPCTHTRRRPNGKQCRFWARRGLGGRSRHRCCGWACFGAAPPLSRSRQRDNVSWWHLLVVYTNVELPRAHKESRSKQSQRSLKNGLSVWYATRRRQRYDNGQPTASEADRVGVGEPAIRKLALAELILEPALAGRCNYGELSSSAPRVLALAGARIGLLSLHNVHYVCLAAWLVGARLDWRRTASRWDILGCLLRARPPQARASAQLACI